MTERALWNGARYDRTSEVGHYESWFFRANHPRRPLAFWIRYTIFAPRGQRDAARGELWVTYFDGETDSVVAAKQERPFDQCFFAKTGLSAKIGAAQADEHGLSARLEGGDHTFEWSLRYTAPEPVLLFFPEALYGAPLPKAKSLVPAPQARFSGQLVVDGEAIDIDEWPGSQNHNWGEKHTDRYAWAQVCGFDDAPDAFLELATAQLKIGPVYTPPMTPLVLRLDGREIKLSAIGQALKAHARYDFFQWSFETHTDDVEISGTIAAPRSAFIGLPYDNPPGGQKTCLNSKVAACHLTVRERGRAVRTLSSRHRAAFEILTDATDHGVSVLEVADGVGSVGHGRFAPGGSTPVTQDLRV